jgi:cytoskeletal protein RodZ
MKTIGQILKDSRIAKSYSLKHLEGVTKIKSGFIDAIEKENWEDLPPFPTVLGFVKSLAGSMGVDTKMAVAVLKRDYPPQKLRIIPKPDVIKKIVWSPKLTFTLGVSAILIILFGYLITQYVHFISPPVLNVASPKENQIVKGNSVVVFGSTETDAKLTVNNQPVMVAPDGKFSISLDIAKDTKEIIIASSSRSGKTTTVSRRIQLEQ